MELLSIYKQNEGFTLIEIIVVVGIFIFILGFGVIYDLGSIKRNDFESQKSILISLLKTARSHAMANIDESPYSVCVVGGEYAVMKGKVCDIVFEQLSGDMFDHQTHSIHITDGEKSGDIKINSVGAIYED